MYIKLDHENKWLIPTARQGRNEILGRLKNKIPLKLERAEVYRN